MSTIFFQIADVPKEIDYLFLIKKAIRAPSGHNSQAWLFRIKEDKIKVYPNFDRSLSVVDPQNRELFISLGCVTENLALASIAKGYKADISCTENGIIFLKLSSNAVDQKNNALYNQIEIRQTNRAVYDGNIIPGETMDMLNATSLEPGISMHTYEKGSSEFKTISNFIRKGNEIQMGDKAFKAELNSWIRFNKKHSERMNDGLSYAVFGAPNLPKFIVKPIIKFSINKRSQIKKDINSINSASHFVLFSSRKNNIKEWINLGRTLQRFLLKSTELGIAHSYFNQPNEIFDLSLEMRAALGIDDEFPAILLRIGYGEKMPYSRRKDVQDMILV